MRKSRNSIIEVCTNLIPPIKSGSSGTLTEMQDMLYCSLYPADDHSGHLKGYQTVKTVKMASNGHNWWLAVKVHLESFSDLKFKIILDGFNGWPPKIFVNRKFRAARQIRNYGLKLS